MEHYLKFVEFYVYGIAAMERRIAFRMRSALILWSLSANCRKRLLKQKIVFLWNEERGLFCLEMFSNSPEIGND